MSLTRDYAVVECQNCCNTELLYRPDEQEIKRSCSKQCCANPDRKEVVFDRDDYLFAIEDALESANWHDQQDIPRRIVQSLEEIANFDLNKMAKAVAEAFYDAI